jgi:hypothetical protein
MKNLRNLLTTIAFVAVLMISAPTAKAGILMSDLTDGDTRPCTETKVESTKIDWGVIVQGFTGVIVQGFTGVIVQGVTNTQVDCGILMSD